MELKYRGNLPLKAGFCKTMVNGQELDYDRIEWEFVSLKPKSIELMFYYFKNNKEIYKRSRTCNFIHYPKTKTVSIMAMNSRLDVTNLLISISNDLFAGCRERNNPRCILTSVEN